MTLLNDIKAALVASGNFEHVSASTLIPVRKFPAVIVEPSKPVMDQDETGEVSLDSIGFDVSVICKFEANSVIEDTYDATLAQLDDRVDNVRSVLFAQKQGIRYSNELISAVEIQGIKCLLWQFEAELIVK